MLNTIDCRFCVSLPTIKTSDDNYVLDEDYEPELCRHQTSRNEYFDAKLTKSLDNQPDSESGKVVHPELPCPQISEAAASSSLCESSSSAMGKETDSIADKNDEESHLERPPPSVQIVSESSSDRSHSQPTDSLVLDSEFYENLQIVRKFTELYNRANILFQNQSKWVLMKTNKLREYFSIGNLIVQLRYYHHLKRPPCYQIFQTTDDVRVSKCSVVQYQGSSTKI